MSAVNGRVVRTGRATFGCRARNATLRVPIAVSSMSAPPLIVRVVAFISIGLGLLVLPALIVVGYRFSYVGIGVATPYLYLLARMSDTGRRFLRADSEVLRNSRARERLVALIGALPVLGLFLSASFSPLILIAVLLLPSFVVVAVAVASRYAEDAVQRFCAEKERALEAMSCDVPGRELPSQGEGTRRPLPPLPRWRA